MRKQFPWRDGNKIELLVDGENFFPVMLDEIKKARYSLLLEFYFVTSGVIAGKFDQILEHVQNTIRRKERSRA